MYRIKFNNNKCTACKTCEIACAVAHSISNDVKIAIFEVPRVMPRVNVVVKNEKIKVLRCVHCKKPKCIEACENSAINKEDDGRVIIDKEKCIGCWKCIESCPFDAIFKNEELNIAIKCDLCGCAETLACVEACPTEALTMEVK